MGNNVSTGKGGLLALPPLFMNMRCVTLESFVHHAWHVARGMSHVPYHARSGCQHTTEEHEEQAVVASMQHRSIAALWYARIRQRSKIAVDRGARYLVRAEEQDTTDQGRGGA